MEIRTLQWWLFSSYFLCDPKLGTPEYPSGEYSMPVNKTAPAGSQTVMKTRMKRKKHKTPPGHPSDADLIASYLASGGSVTQCGVGRAMGSLNSSDHGLRGS